MRTFALLLTLLSGCEIIAPAELRCPGCEARLEVHLNNNFDGDRVVVRLDDDVVFDGRATTNYVWSLAEIIRTVRPEGTYRLSVEVNGTHRAAERLNLEDMLYVHVRFYDEAIPALGIPHGVIIEPTTTRPLYD